MKTRHDVAGLVAILTLALTMLACAFGLYGRFVRLEQRMDESDVDRHAMMDTMNRIEQRVIDIEEAWGDGAAKVRR